MSLDDRTFARAPIRDLSIMGCELRNISWGGSTPYVACGRYWKMSARSVSKRHSCNLNLLRTQTIELPTFDSISATYVRCGRDAGRVRIPTFRTVRSTIGAGPSRHPFVALSPCDRGVSQTANVSAKSSSGSSARTPGHVQQTFRENVMDR